MSKRKFEKDLLQAGRLFEKAPFMRWKLISNNQKSLTL